MRISDLSSDVCSSDLRTLALRPDITRQVGRIATSRLAQAPRPLRLCYAGQVVQLRASQLRPAREMLQVGAELIGSHSVAAARELVTVRSEEHTSELQSLMRNSYAVFCLKKQQKTSTT